MEGVGAKNGYHIIFNQRVNLNHIPNWDSLARRNILLQSTSCMFCGSSEEISGTYLHYVWYDGTSMVKDQLARDVAFNRVCIFFWRPHGDSLPQRVRGDDNFKKMVHAIFMATTLSILRHKNDILFNRACPLENKVTCKITALTSIWLKTWSKNKGTLVLKNFSFDPVKLFIFHVIHMLCCLFQRF